MDLNAQPKWEAVAGLLSLDPDKIFGVLYRLWQFCWATRSSFIGAGQFQAIARVDHPGLLPALELFGFVDLSDEEKIRVRGMDRYAKQNEAKAEAGRKGGEASGAIRRARSRASKQAEAGASKQAKQNEAYEYEDQDLDQEKKPLSSKLDLVVQEPPSPSQPELPVDDGKPYSGHPPVERVFKLWQELMQQPRAKLDARRRKLIARALDDYSLEDCMWAVNGCASSPFHMGDNERRQRYNSIDVIFRSNDQIDKFIALRLNPVQRSRL